jgi:DNA-binding NtrC family response regulator
LPPLRERLEDIPLLVDHFLEKYNREANRRVTKVSRKVLDVLLAYSWPGNVRELENCIERAVVMSPDTSVSLGLLPEEIRENHPDNVAVPLSNSTRDPQAELRQAVIRFLTSRKKISGARESLLETVEEALLRHLLDSGKYSQRELADLLAMSRVTLRKKLDQYGLS